MSCDNCEPKEQKEIFVPYIVHESGLAREERSIKRLWIVILVLILLLAASNCAWLVYESQFEVVEQSTTIDATQDGTGKNIIGVGDIYGSKS